MRAFSIVLILAAATSASAQSISAHPTLLFGTADVSQGQYNGTLNLGLDARTPVAAGFSAEAFVSANLSDSTAQNGSSSFALQDNSSFVRLGWTPTNWAEKEGLALTLMPFHADRIYFGYEFPLVYDLKTTAPMSSDDGAVLRIARAGAYGALSARSNVGVDVQDREEHRHYAAIASAGYDVFDLLLVEAQVGHQDLGINPVPQVLGASVTAVAAAARVTFHHGTPIGPLVDVERYRSDPAFWETCAFRPSRSPIPVRVGHPRRESHPSPQKPAKSFSYLGDSSGAAGDRPLRNR